jgi:hypothetical protein
VELVHLFIWLEKTRIAVLIQESTYLFPLIEVVHLLGLTLLLGSILLVDLKLLGAPIQRQSLRRLAAQINPFASLGLAIMVLTGVPLLASEATKCYQNPAFWWKMQFLAAALVFHYGVRGPLVKRETLGRFLAVLVGVVSLFLWSGVGMSGRAIAFV